MSITYRQATIHDLDALTRLFDAYRQFYGQPAAPVRARDFLAARFGHRQSLIWLAFDTHGEALGFTQRYPLFSSVRTARIYLLNDLFVDAKARRRGVAGLLNAAAAAARALGAVGLSRSTALDNEPAQRLYESLGWQRDHAFCEYSLKL